MAYVADDPTQRITEALCRLTDTAAALVALTGRASGNVVEWETLADAARPCVALHVVSCTAVPGGFPNTYDVQTQWTAVAPRDGTGDGPFGRALCHEMLSAIEGAVTGPAFQNLATVPGAVWALVGSPQRTPIARARRSSDARVDLSLPLTATLFG
jgi:hypothetical protein